MFLTVNRIILALASILFLEACGCATHSNRLIVGRRPPPIVQLQESHLRPVINPPLSSVARAVGYFTTPFKRAGIFGWRDMQMDVVVTGVVRQVATSTDHFVTADLRVEKITANGTPVPIDSERYLRAEICARRIGLPDASVPCASDRVRIAGRLKWDADGNGFLEVHPQRAADVEILERGKPCVTPRE